MGNVYIFRGIAGTGKTTLTDMLAKKLSIPVFHKDDIVDALIMTEDTDLYSDKDRNSTICYNILYNMAQTHLNLNVDFIMDIGLGSSSKAKRFFDRLDLKGNKIFKFLIVCSDEREWERRHIERIENPLPRQLFKSLEHAKEHYKNFHVTPFEDECLIDNIGTIEKSFKNILEFIDVI